MHENISNVPMDGDCMSLIYNLNCNMNDTDNDVVEGDNLSTILC